MACKWYKDLKYIPTNKKKVKLLIGKNITLPSKTAKRDLLTSRLPAERFGMSELKFLMNINLSKDDISPENVANLLYYDNQSYLSS